MRAGVMITVLLIAGLSACENGSKGKSTSAAAAEAEASGPSPCLGQVEKWCACREQVISNSGMDERAAAAIQRGIDANRKAAARSEEACRKVLEALPKNDACSNQ